MRGLYGVWKENNRQSIKELVRQVYRNWVYKNVHPSDSFVLIGFDVGEDKWWGGVYKYTLSDIHSAIESADELGTKEIIISQRVRLVRDGYDSEFKFHDFLSVETGEFQT